MVNNSETKITIRNIPQKTIQIIDEEAQKNKISRNSLLQIIIENFAENAEQNNATKLLSGPLEDVVNQLNVLTKTMNNSTKVAGDDIQAISDQLTQLNFTMGKFVSINKQLLEKFNNY